MTEKELKKALRSIRYDVNTDAMVIKTNTLQQLANLLHILITEMIWSDQDWLAMYQRKHNQPFTLIDASLLRRIEAYAIPGEAPQFGFYLRRSEQEDT